MDTADAMAMTGHRNYETSWATTARGIPSTGSQPHACNHGESKCLSSCSQRHAMLALHYLHQAVLSFIN